MTLSCGALQASAQGLHNWHPGGEVCFLLLASWQPPWPHKGSVKNLLTSDGFEGKVLEYGLGIQKW